MMQEMFFRLIFSIGSLFFILLLLISYVSKGFKFRLRNTIFILMMFSCIGMLVFEIVANMYLAIGSIQLLLNILAKIYCIFLLFWGVLLLNYIYCLVYKPDFNTYKELITSNTLLKNFSIFSILILLAILFLPVPPIDERTFNFMFGLPTYYCMLHYFVSNIIVIYLIIKNFRNLTSTDRILSVIIVLIVPIAIIIRIWFPASAFLGLCYCLQLFLLYFYYENPDLFMIEEITKLTEQTEKISKIKSEFLSNMSHEIRSPMNAIMGFSETILNDTEFDKERVINDISIIESSSKNLLEIINNILDISKIESNQDTLEEKDYSFDKIIKDLTAITETRIASKPIKLIFNIEEGIPNRLHGDSTKIFQVLLNILTNAAKYTEVGKIVVDINKEIVDDKILLSIKVSDTGYGIKKEDYNKMFEKFSRLDEATTNEIEGTGLGLVITKRYVNLMQGKIWFESEYGVGTTFFVDIPQIICKNQDEVDEEEETNPSEAAIKNTDLSRFKVLIVDDNKLNIKVAQRIIMGYGIQVETCMSGKDCIYKFKEGIHYDMIFMDHMMPEMDGIETFHILRKLEGYYQPPIIALTANAVAGAKDMYISEGFDDYLSKPIDTKELERIIDKFFINRH